MIENDTNKPLFFCINIFVQSGASMPSLLFPIIFLAPNESKRYSS